MVAVDDRERAIGALGRDFRVERFPHSVDVSAGGSSLRRQIRTDPRCDAFVAGASVRDVLGWPLPGAELKNVLQGKIWAAEDPARRASKRLEDLTDIARLLEKYPELRPLVPQPLLARID